MQKQTLYIYILTRLPIFYSCLKMRHLVILIAPNVSFAKFACVVARCIQPLLLLIKQLPFLSMVAKAVTLVSSRYLPAETASLFTVRLLAKTGHL